MKWKVCGLKSKAAVQAVVSGGANFAGFITYPPSPRAIALSQFDSLRPLLGEVEPVMVDVQPTLEQVKDGLAAGFRRFQFHLSPGEEALVLIHRYRECLQAAGAKLWLVPRLAPGESFPQSWLGGADGFLLDGYRAGMHGGTGQLSDWELYVEMSQQFPDLEWVLAGGLSPENVLTAYRQTKAAILDFNSTLESTPGEKDPARISHLANLLRSLNPSG